MSKVSRDQDRVAGQGEFQEREIVGIGEEVGGQGSGQHPCRKIVQPLEQGVAQGGPGGNRDGGGECAREAPKRLTCNRRFF